MQVLIQAQTPNMKFKRIAKFQTWNKYNKEIMAPLVLYRLKILSAKNEQEVLACIKGVESIASELDSMIDYCLIKLDNLDFKPSLILDDYEFKSDVSQLYIKREVISISKEHKKTILYFNYIIENAIKFQSIYYLIK